MLHFGNNDKVCVILCYCSVYIYVVFAGLEGAVALSASSLTTCYDTPVYLHCHHLDLTSRIEGKHVFGSNFPHWKLNGSVIALDGITYKRHYYYSKTQTVLRIVFNRQEFRDSPYVYTCFFKLFNGSILESNPLEVQINVNCEISLQNHACIQIFPLAH